MQYAAAVAHVRGVVFQNLKVKEQAALELASTFTYEPRNLTVFGAFQSFGRTAISLAHARTAGIAPVVLAEDRAAADAFTAAHAADLAGPEFSALQPAQQQALLSALRGGMKEASPRTSETGAVIGIDFVPASAPADDSSPASSQAPYYFAPALQMTPLAGTLGSWNLNARNSTDRRLAMDRALASRAASSTGLVLLGSDVFANVIRASTTVYAPMLFADPRTSETAVTGFAFVSFSWDDLLADAMPDYASIDIVIASPQPTISTLGPSNAPSDKFTLRIEGGAVSNVGFGDLASPKRTAYAHEIRASLGGLEFSLTVR